MNTKDRIKETEEEKLDNICFCQYFKRTLSGKESSQNFQFSTQREPILSLCIRIVDSNWSRVSQTSK